MLGEALGVEGRADSQRLGGAIFFLLAHVVHELLANGVSVIAEGNFTAQSPLFRDLPPARIVQVHVTAEPELLRTRMLERAGARHTGALGSRKPPTRSRAARRRASGRRSRSQESWSRSTPTDGPSLDELSRPGRSASVGCLGYA